MSKVSEWHTPWITGTELQQLYGFPDHNAVVEALAAEQIPRHKIGFETFVVIRQPKLLEWAERLEAA